MATTLSLRSHLIDELRDLLDGETQLTEALPKLANAATSKTLQSAFQKHLKETRNHITRLNQALQGLGEKRSPKTCKAMKGLLDEGAAMLKMAPAGPLRDAVIITGAQKVEHYEMASYGTARTYANVLGEKAVARLLAQTLKEEKVADRTLTRIAEENINDDAEQWQSQEESMLTRTAEWAGSTAGFASRQLSKGLQAAASTVGWAGARPSTRQTGGRKRAASGRRRPATEKKR